MAGPTNLVVPIVMWGRSAPAHCISSVYLLRDQRTLVTGSHDGQVILWQLEDTESWLFTPRHMLIGHTAPVRCIAKASPGTDCHHVVTASESGEMFCWDTVDGACVESKKHAMVHTNIQSYRVPDSNQVKLFCCGFYEEVMVFDPYSLEVLFQLSSRINPDWISAFHVLRPRNRQDDVVLALTISGTVKVWTLNGQEDRSKAILENESKRIRCMNAVSMTCCVYNMRTVLVVCANFWSVYDAGDFTCLLSVPCVPSERWLGGEFISADRICCWSDSGSGFLYKLPTNCIVESKDFHNKSAEGSAGRPLLFAEFRAGPSSPAHLPCPPAFKYVIFSREGRWQKFLLRGAADGGLLVWRVPDTPECAALQLKAEAGEPPGVVAALQARTLAQCWDTTRPSPVGVLDQLDENMNENAELGEMVEVDTPALTSHIFLPALCRLVVGRSDGSIVLVPATQTIMLHLLAGRHHKYTSWPTHQLLRGHAGRVNCLLYPNNENPRYDANHLVSGGIDFSVCLWDIRSGALLHRFSCHGGEVLRLQVPPPGVSPRVGHCVCGVASDHSVTLLSLKERRCVMLASRQIFPVLTVKWKPQDDFLLVGCTDGTLYIWQMETGHLDRVVSGMAAQDVLEACEDPSPGAGGAAAGGESAAANPALGLLRGIRHRNLAAIRLATQRGINMVQGPGDKEYQYQEKVRAFPLVVDGFRTNQSTAEGHILFFDVEALIVQLLTEEYSAMSPGTMEVQGLTNQAEYDRVRALTKVASPDTARKITGFLSKVKGEADSRLQAGLGASASPETQRKLTGLMGKMKDVAKEGAEKAKGELGKAVKELEERSGIGEDGLPGGETENALRPNSLQLEINLTLEIGQLLLSLLHAWGLDRDLDKVAASKLGLLKPKLPASFGLVSRCGGMSLLLPTWSPRPPPGAAAHLSPTEYFTSLGHWELSHSLTTQHLISLIAITNTLTSVSNASFVPEQERKRKLVRQATHGAMESLGSGPTVDSGFGKQQEQIKAGWSLLSTLHCVLLSEKVRALGSQGYKKLQVELLAMKWQDRCLQVRLAAQELLVAELKNLGPGGRAALAETWAEFIPKYGDPPFQSQVAAPTNGQTNGAPAPAPPGGQLLTLEEDEEERPEDEADPGAAAARRNQTTAVILCAVLGALFDLEQERAAAPQEPAALGTALVRLTAKALMYLVLAPADAAMPSHTPLRRAAIDLIGRGFTLWEPHLEVSKVLLGLLDMSSEADRWIPSQRYGLPLTPVADCCRTARHALAAIARARPGVFVTSVAKEIARYNTLATNAQTLNVNLNTHILTRSKAEVLHVVEQLINLDAALSEMRDLLTDVVDIVLHCVDTNHLKQRPLADVFPPIQTFNQVSHCTATRRIAVGTKQGNMVMYELRASRVQHIPAHQAPVTALAFNQDGKNLVTYSANENKLSFWQTSTGMFGLGQAVTRCTKSYNTTPVPLVVTWNPLRSPRLVWVGARTVTLLLPDGTETRFNC